ncbi:MAG: hypothetical protein JNJ58_11500 [Chitinophagaceae bacterium]|nr:hypothetical protein [Chitinophagaceae bacterium]
MNQDFIKKSDNAFSLQLKNFSDKLADHQTLLGLLPDDLADAKKASDSFRFAQDMQLAHAERSKNWTSYKDLLRTADSHSAAVNEAPVSLVVPTPPPSLSTSIEAWFRQIVKRIKGSKNYTEAIGDDLGILRIPFTINLEDAKPSISVNLIAGQPQILWTKKGFDGIEIFKDKGDGQWELLKYDTRPHHLDTSQLPPVGETAIWKYKCIYRYQDERVGEWSNVLSVIVTGNV